MLPNDCKFGLIWWGSETWYGEEGCWSHGGLMRGVRTMIRLFPHKNSGFIILTNSENSYERLGDILKQLIDQIV